VQQIYAFYDPFFLAAQRAFIIADNFLTGDSLVAG
jgi:hypothetical protein